LLSLCLNLKLVPSCNVTVSISKVTELCGGVFIHFCYMWHSLSHSPPTWTDRQFVDRHGQRSNEREASVALCRMQTSASKVQERRVVSTACLSHYGNTRTLPNDERTDEFIHTFTDRQILEPANSSTLVEQKFVLRIFIVYIKSGLICSKYN
jgi:hypothetical protein